MTVTHLSGHTDLGRSLPPLAVTLFTFIGAVWVNALKHTTINAPYQLRVLGEGSNHRLLTGSDKCGPHSWQKTEKRKEATTSLGGLSLIHI